MVRSPPLAARAVTEPSLAGSTAGRSLAGPPCASVPPIVPRLRTCWSAICFAAVEARPISSLSCSSTWRGRGPGRPHPFPPSPPPRPVRPRAPPRVVELGEVDEQRRAGEPHLHERQERVPAREDLRVLATVRERREGLVERVGRDVVELGGDHAAPPVVSSAPESDGRVMPGGVVGPDPAEPASAGAPCSVLRAWGDRKSVV